MSERVARARTRTVESQLDGPGFLRHSSKSLFAFCQILELGHGLCGASASRAAKWPLLGARSGKNSNMRNVLTRHKCAV